MPIDKLRERLGDPEHITSSHITSSLQLPVVQRHSDVRTVRVHHDGAVASIRALEAQGLNPDIYNQFYKPMLM